MLIQLIRKQLNEGCTLGELLIDGAHFAYTLEDKYRGQLENPADKVQNETCIPCGSYKAIADMSNHFQKVLPRILNVPCFDGVRIHGGNTKADTEGCVLIGADTNGVDRISNCAELVEEITAKIQAAGSATIEISIAEPIA